MSAKETPKVTKENEIKVKIKVMAKKWYILEGKRQYSTLQVKNIGAIESTSKNAHRPRKLNVAKCQQ